jgi:hypothetical protein
MGHLSSIGASIFTDLSVAVGTLSGGSAGAAVLPASDDDNGFKALFPAPVLGVCKWLRLENVREFPAFGSTPNLVKVPVYGQKNTMTIGGQSDMPDFTVNINYVGSRWAKGTTATTFTAGTSDVAVYGSEFANMVGDGVSRAWRLALMASDPSVGFTKSGTTSAYASLPGGLGVVPNSVFYFKGRIESMQITPSLTDAVQATLAFSIQSDFYGAFTY